MAITVKDLANHIGLPSNDPRRREFLYCEVCGSRYSANAGDYFMNGKDHVFTCCDEPMSLATTETQVVIVKPGIDAIDTLRDIFGLKHKE